MENYQNTIASQYARFNGGPSNLSPNGTITKMIAAFNAAADPGPNIDAFYDNVWNIATATGYGLDVWGRIVGIGKNITIPSGSYFGFQESDITSSFTGYISGTSLYVSTGGTGIAVGNTINGVGVSAGTVITGGTSSPWPINNSQTVGSSGSPIALTAVNLASSPYALPFGSGIFYTASPSSSNFALADPAYRQLILIKALFNISDGTIPTYNKIARQIKALFSTMRQQSGLPPITGNAYVIDNGSMSMTLKLSFVLLPYEYSILTQSGAFTAPTGVALTISSP